MPRVFLFCFGFGSRKTALFSKHAASPQSADSCPALLPIAVLFSSSTTTPRCWWSYRLFSWNFVQNWGGGWPREQHNTFKESKKNTQHEKKNKKKFASVIQKKYKVFFLLDVDRSPIGVDYQYSKPIPWCTIVRVEVTLPVVEFQIKILLHHRVFVPVVGHHGHLPVKHRHAKRGRRSKFQQLLHAFSTHRCCFRSLVRGTGCAAALLLAVVGRLQRGGVAGVERGTRGGVGGGGTRQGARVQTAAAAAKPLDSVQRCCAGSVERAAASEGVASGARLGSMERGRHQAGQAAAGRGQPIGNRGSPLLWSL